MPNIVTANEPDFRNKVVFNNEMAKVKSLAVACISKVRQMTHVSASAARCLGLGEVPKNVDIVIKRKSAVDTIDLIGTAAVERYRAVRK